jgi:hypothetical protein
MTAMLNEIQMGNHQEDLSLNANRDDRISPALVRDELNRMVASRHFRTSRRSKEFLQYVVNQKISGSGELLKERLIGVEIFGRKPDYAVGEDPVVRVLAGDVRHRLERYHADPECHSDILIQIPLGSYAPVFRLRKDSHADEPSTGDLAKRDRPETDSAGVNIPHGTDLRESNPDTMPSATEKRPSSVSYADASTIQSHDDDAAIVPPRGDRHRFILQRAVIPVLACLALAGYLVSSYFHKRPDPTLKAFWLPASVSPKPVLLWLPKPMVYRPSDELFEKYGKSHPNGLVTREARQDKYLPLEPTDTLQWRDMVPVHDSGPGIGGVIAAINMSKLLTQQGIRFEIRFGSEATYAEMRDSPAVIVGAINTDWATQLTSGQPLPLTNQLRRRTFMKQGGRNGSGRWRLLMDTRPVITA